MSIRRNTDKKPIANGISGIIVELSKMRESKTTMPEQKSTRRYESEN